MLVQQHPHFGCGPLGEPKAPGNRERVFVMSGVDDDELQALRVRAYGPNADIHRDATALTRLRELEEASRPRIEHVPDDAPPAELPAKLPVSAETPPAPVDDDDYDPMGDRLQRVARRVGSWVVIAAIRIRRLRRSTVLTALALVVTTAVIVTALVVVERVQTDPLQVGATQVARLPIDPTYRVPAVFAGAGDSDITGFQEFYGLRAIVGSQIWFGEGGDICFNLYSSADITDPASQSYSGNMMYGCAAGGFPAMIQFKPDTDGFPEELSAAFEDSSGLQFVYDSENNEIVVFATE